MKSFFSRTRSNRLTGNQGSEIAEAAVVLPVLFLLLFSIYWFGKAFSIYGTINHAAREGARTAAVPACASCDAVCTWQGSDLPCDAAVISAVNNALIAAHLDPTLAQPFVPSPPPVACPPGVLPAGICATAASGGFTICRNVALDQSSAAPQVCGVIVSFRYPYQLALPFSSLNNQQILLKAEVEMQGEN
jgi:hypothetical protein